MEDEPSVSGDHAVDDALGLAALVDGAPIGLALVDADLRYVRVNAGLARITGAPPAAHIGRRIGEFAEPSLREELQLAARLALDGGEPVAGVELEGRTLRRPDAERRWIVDFRPVRQSDGAVGGLTLSAREVTLERQTDGQHALTAGLAQAASVDDVARAAIEHVLPLTGGSHAAVGVVAPDGRTLRLVRRQSVPGEIEGSWVRHSLDDALPFADALRRRSAVLVESRAELLARYPPHASGWRRPEPTSAATSTTPSRSTPAHGGW